MIEVVSVHGMHTSVVEKPAVGDGAGAALDAGNAAAVDS